MKRRKPNNFDHGQIERLAALEIGQAGLVVVHEFADVSAIFFVGHAGINCGEPFKVRFAFGGREFLFGIDFRLDFLG